MLIFLGLKDSDYIPRQNPYPAQCDPYNMMFHDNSICILYEHVPCAISHCQCHCWECTIV